MHQPTEDAEDLLERFHLLQAQHDEHLRRISDECELGLRDKQGQSTPTGGSDDALRALAATVAVSSWR
ncbi:hypothetical protein B5E41_30590 [Rhizobium esperanzae]|uniref:Uncharacterized protein n=1 Tax=Rhizobium esperanzae TaxID=1967781 RepID=A0A2D0AAB3_9HYPH|nr:hypothetical protein B5E41_30590 [Rhizobium esperanzae]